MRGLGPFGGQGLVVEIFGPFRVQGQLELVAPAEIEARPR